MSRGCLQRKPACCYEPRVCRRSCSWLSSWRPTGSGRCGGRVAVEFTLSDEGRLKPLDAVELNIPGQDNDQGGESHPDLALPLEMKKSAAGSRSARVELRQEWAGRAVIRLTSASFDGKQAAATRYHHVIPVAGYMKNPPAAADPADAQWMKMFQLMYDMARPVKDSRLERLKALIDQGADVNMAIGFDRMLRVGETRADLRGTTWPLDVAVRQGRIDMVKLLLASGAKLHGKELAQAAFAANPDEALAMATVLLQAGADANSRDGGFPALSWASHRGNKNLVKLLLTQPGLQLDRADPDGRTPLMAAAERGHSEVVGMLLETGANAAVTGPRGETAASLARKTLAKQQEVVEDQQAMVAKLQP